MQWEQAFKAYFFQLKSLEELTYNQLLEYIMYKESQGIKRATLVHILNRIQVYFNYLEVDNPLEHFKLKGAKQNEEKVFLTAAQLKGINILYFQNNRLSLLSKIAISLLIYQGLSTAELPKIQAHYFDINKAIIHLPKGILQARTLPLEAVQILALSQYLPQTKNYQNLLHYTTTTQAKKRHYHWKNQIQKELDKHQITIPYQNLQQLRSSRIAHWIKSQGILQAQYLAGHQSLSSTQRYQSQDHQALRASLEQAHPLF